eukprot:TRINITY_DN9121_c0_g3_i2.p1 TRINITY_DN9121_c0_g3~~TRINITY_DN9121_c0_g3_i2.p1  ORF type:complete len:182 (+),score=49.98 TRINITY_DN9121_c0_g3_i2:132-677(+)
MQKLPRHRKHTNSFNSPITLSLKLTIPKTKKMSDTSLAEKSTARSENKEIVEHLLSELEAIGLQVEQNHFEGAPRSKEKSYKEIVRKTGRFSTDKGRAQYLLKELENAMIKIESLEASIKALKKENTSWKHVLQASVNNKSSVGNSDLKEEASYLEGIVGEQHAMLEAFKREVIERFCLNK